MGIHSAMTSIGTAPMTVSIVLNIALPEQVVRSKQIQAFVVLSIFRRM